MADTTKKASVQIVNEEQENMAVTEVETTEEENKTLIRMNEDDFIQGLISAADYAKDDTQRIEIARNGKVLFAFEIRPLSEEEYNKCKKKHTKYVRNKQFGMKLPEETNTVKFRDALIYTATVEADREKLWDNKKVWESLRAITPDEFYKKPHGVQAFMLASMRIYLESTKGGEEDGGNNTN